MTFTQDRAIYQAIGIGPHGKVRISVSQEYFYVDEEGFIFKSKVKSKLKSKEFIVIIGEEGSLLIKNEVVYLETEGIFIKYNIIKSEWLRE